MRDRARIERIIAQLRTAWLASPDQRLGQLIVNLASSLQEMASDSTEYIIWHSDDEAWEAAMGAWMEARR